MTWQMTFQAFTNMEHVRKFFEVMPLWAKIAAAGAISAAAHEMYKRLTETDLHGQVAVITGAGSGIGRLMALKLAGQGVKCILWDLNAPGVEAVAQEITASGGIAKAYACDVTNREAVAELALECISDFGQVDILVCVLGLVDVFLCDSRRLCTQPYCVGVVSLSS